MSEMWPDEAGEAPAILTEMRGAVAIVTLNRPAKLNAWTPAMGTLYFDTLDRLAADADVRAILVAGAGRGFCAGADMSGLGNLAASGGEMSGREQRRYWYPMSIGKPIVAAIHGACYGVGMQQALCCDLRFAASDARLALPYTQRGLNAEVGTSWLLSRIAGAANAMDLLMSGRAIDGETAKAMGLVNATYPAGELLARALEYCTALAEKCSPWSMRIMKQQVYHDLMTTLTPAFARSETLLAEALAGADFAEGIKAFREKRAPAFPALPPSLARLDPWPEG